MKRLALLLTSALTVVVLSAAPAAAQVVGPFGAERGLTGSTAVSKAGFGIFECVRLGGSFTIINGELVCVSGTADGGFLAVR